ncbi:zinc protease, partial [gut metagenome]
RDGISEQELEEAKRGFIEYRTVNRAQDHVLARNWLRLMDKDRDWHFSKELDHAVSCLTVEEVNRAICRLADPSQLTVVVAGDLQKAKDAGADFSQR